MVTTVNLNPCIDKSIFVDNFQAGELNRVKKSREDISGKGINVAMVLQTLGVDVECIGFNYRNDGDKLTNFLENAGIPHDFVEVDGALRTNTKVLDMHSKQFTELNEAGDYVTEADIKHIKQKVREHAAKSNLVVISGSVPQGVPSSIYREIIDEMNSIGVRVVLDAEKALLAEGMKAKPFLVKPNMYELETIYNVKCKSRRDVIPLMLDLVRQGVSIVCVSLGGEGAYITDGEKIYYTPVLNLDIRGFQGAGDSMVAGLCKAIEEKRDLADMIRYGTAAASASLVMEGTQLCKKEGFEKYLKQVVVTEEKYEKFL